MYILIKKFKQYRNWLNMIWLICQIKKLFDSNKNLEIIFKKNIMTIIYYIDPNNSGYEAIIKP
jgi:hypothetical protein